MVKPTVLLSFIFLFFVSAWMLFSSIDHLKTGIRNQAAENQMLKSEGEKIAALKGEWENKPRIKQTLKRLRALPKLTQNHHRGSRYLLQYSQLNPDELNVLSNELFNSSCTIKIYELKRIDLYNASVYVEIEL